MAFSKKPEDKTPPKDNKLLPIIGVGAVEYDENGKLWVLLTEGNSAEANEAANILRRDADKLKLRTR